MNNKYLFRISTPIGLTIRTTRDYWDLIRIKHPEVSDKLVLIKEMLKMPDLITKSKIDTSVLLFYKKINSYWLCAVVKSFEIDGYLVTAYITDKIKEGVRIWPN